MREELLKLLSEYKETKECIELGINWIDKKDYAQGKLDLVNIIIADLQKLAEKN